MGIDFVVPVRGDGRKEESDPRAMAVHSPHHMQSIALLRRRVDETKGLERTTRVTRCHSCEPVPALARTRR
jgi:hypothetical protein